MKIAHSNTTDGDHRSIAQKPIPQFPSFKLIDLSDKAVVEEYVRHFPPYSDFNFPSLWCYDTRADHALAWLNRNLVVRLRDYLTGDPVFTLLGCEDIASSLETLWQHSNKMGLPGAIRLLPEEVRAQCNGSLSGRFEFAEEEADFDYIINLDVLESMDAPELSAKRRRVAKLRRDHSDIKTRSLDLGDGTTRKLIMSLCETWCIEKHRPRHEFATERIAIERALNDAGHFRFTTVGAIVDDILAGFTINEAVHDRFYMAHFGKSDPRLRGVSDFLESETAKIMRVHGCQWMNFQQDLGLAGLRKYKRSWGTRTFLKKYTLTPNPITHEEHPTATQRAS